jgi:tRNA nucleotidyltransferase (CCA-adding enzyme)
MEVIATHISADFDAVAAMVLARKLYPGARLIFPGSQERNVREFLRRFPELGPFHRLKEIRLEEIERLILVDTAQPGRIGELVRLIEEGRCPVHVFDHHPSQPEDIRGERHEVRPYGATSTVLWELLCEAGLGVTPLEATAAALGIYEDTGLLTFASTTSADVRAVADLLDAGANLKIVSDFAKKEMTPEQVALLGRLIEGSEEVVIHGNPIVIAVASVDRYVDDMAVLVHKLIDMEHLNVCFAIVRMADRVLLVGRSRSDEVNVGLIAAEFGGGGHHTAASATIRDRTVGEVRERLLQLLPELVRPAHTAGDIMTGSVKAVDAEATISAALEKMIQHGVNALPVARNDVLVGAITRQVCDKAIQHGLGDRPVEAYLTEDVPYVPEDANISAVLDMMTEHRLHFLPVVRGREVVGIITRMDLLSLFQSERSQSAVYRGEAAQDAPFYERNVSGLIQEQLPARALEILDLAGRTGDELGVSVYLVGGIVRDILLRRPNVDIDLVVEGDGIAFARELSGRLGGRCSPHAKFGTATIVLPDGFRLDVATARTEHYAQPAALPEVESGSLKQDLYRRDFTINALAIGLTERHRGRLIDYFGGLKDLKDGRIRVLHGLSFVDDPTRAFRAVRFEQRFGFRLGKQTERFIVNAVNMGMMAHLSGPRVFNELQHILAESDPIPALRRLESLQLLAAVDPDLRMGPATIRLLEEVRHVLSWWRMQYRSRPLEEGRLPLMALLDQLSPAALRRFVERMRLPRRIRVQLEQGFQDVRRLLQLCRPRHGVSDADIYFELHGLPLETILFAMAKARSRTVKRKLAHYVTHLRTVRPELSGHDLIAMGFKPGPLFGEIKSRLLRARFEGSVRTREDEVALVRREFGARAGVGSE